VSDLIHLAHGGHDTREDGTCLLEAVAWMAGEAHTDHPACVSPILAAYGRALNDLLPDEPRQRLLPYRRPMIGTRGDGLDEARGYLALDWLIRTYTPAWLDVAGLTAEAATLRGSRRIADLAAAQAVRPAVINAQDKAAAAWDADWDADWAAAWDAAGAAAWDAAWDAARAAAGAAARAADWAAAWAAARAADWAAARAADWAAARDAAGAAAWDKLAPTVTALQDSAISLLGAMINPAAMPGQPGGGQAAPEVRDGG